MNKPLGPSYSPSPSKGTSHQPGLLENGKQLSLIGSLCVVTGALLPWAIADTALGRLTFNGLDYDGAFTGGLGLLVLIGALMAKIKPGQRYSVLVSIAGLIIGYISYLSLSNLSEISSTTRFAVVSPAIGLYLTLIGALIVIIGGITRYPPEPATVAERETNI